MTYRHITFQDNQTEANRILRSYGYNAGSAIPIDPEKVARKMGWGTVPYANLRKNYGIKGFVTKYGEKLQIWIDEYHFQYEPESSLLTVGEELGHCVLHLEGCGNIESAEQWMEIMYRNQKHHSFIHQQARLFASNIMLPAFVFDTYVREWVRENLEDVKKFARVSPNDLASTIGFLMEDELGLSQWIIEHTLKRWPNPVVNQIKESYPELQQM